MADKSVEYMDMADIYNKALTRQARKVLDNGADTIAQSGGLSFTGMMNRAATAEAAIDRDIRNHFPRVLDFNQSEQAMQRGQALPLMPWLTDAEQTKADLINGRTMTMPKVKYMGNPPQEPVVQTKAKRGRGRPKKFVNIQPKPSASSPTPSVPLYADDPRFKQVTTIMDISHDTQSKSKWEAIQLSATKARAMRVHTRTLGTGVRFEPVLPTTGAPCVFDLKFKGTSPSSDRIFKWADLPQSNIKASHIQDMLKGPLPTMHAVNSCGYDIRIMTQFSGGHIIQPGCYYKFPTGLTLADDFKFGKLYISMLIKSLWFDRGLLLCNSAINGYTNGQGEQIFVCVRNITKDPMNIMNGTILCEAIVMNYYRGYVRGEQDNMFVHTPPDTRHPCDGGYDGDDDASQPPTPVQYRNVQGNQFSLAVDEVIASEFEPVVKSPLGLAAMMATIAPPDAFKDITLAKCTDPDCKYWLSLQPWMHDAMHEIDAIQLPDYVSDQECVEYMNNVN
jgi:dUTPase